MVSVGYKLAPEHQFPEGLEDAYAATCWASQYAAEFGADPSCIAVAGECCFHLRDNNAMFCSGMRMAHELPAAAWIELELVCACQHNCYLLSVLHKMAGIMLQ